MGKWAAANSSPSKKSSQSSSPTSSLDESLNSTSRIARKKRIRKNAETSEAAQARLTNSYTVGMNCVGALHKASAFVAKSWKDDPGVDETIGNGGDDDGKDGTARDGEKGTLADLDGDAMFPDSSKGDDSKGKEPTDSRENFLCQNTDRKEGEKMDIDLVESLIVGKSSMGCHDTGRAKEGELSDDVNHSKPHDPSQTTADKGNTDPSSETPHPIKIKPPLLSKTDEREVQVNKLRRAATAARRCIEQSVLLDPIIAPYVPTFRKTYFKFDGREDFPPSSLALSNFDKNHVRELAYLSLLNYADLLISCCTCQKGHKKEKQQRGSEGSRSDGASILDTTKKDLLEAFRDSDDCCWREEEPSRTKRLALVAYCDASDLDGSDPTLWFKIAKATRSLDWAIMDAEPSEDISFRYRRKYGRLERHALEMGKMCLPSHVPPNRSVVRALRELKEEEEDDQGMFRPVILDGQDHLEKVELVIDLPRYSWSTLGRILMKSCREGSAYTPFPEKPGLPPFSFGSPCVVLNISHVLTLPPTVLGTVCEFLGSGYEWKLSQDVKKFESTCRALSVAIISARASLEQERNQQVLEARHSLFQRKEEEREAMGEEEEKVIPINSAVTTCQDDANPKPTHPNPNLSDNLPQSSRTSKRVQSQLITSGKQAARNAKRNSVEYCVLSVLSSKPNDPEYARMVQSAIRWEELPAVARGTERIRDLMSSSSDTTKLQERKNEESRLMLSPQERQSARVAEAAALGGKSSLNDFLRKWSGKNSGPMDVLRGFLEHIAMHSEAVFSSESNGMMMLSSGFLDYFDLLNNRTGHISRPNLAPSWLSDDTHSFDGTQDSSIETFAINLLNGELRMKRCERLGIDTDDYDSDANAVAFIVPELIRLVGVIGDGNFNEFRSSLKIRCHFLAAVYYLWWSRNSNIPPEVTETQDVGIRHIDSALEELRKASSAGTVLIVRTPHLENLTREGNHWRELSIETLSVYKDDLEASSVISSARQRFSDLHSRRIVKSYDGDETTFSDKKDVLGEIGDQLLRRYDIEGAHVKYHDELVSDFISSHGNELDSANIGINGDEGNNGPPIEVSADGVRKQLRSKWGNLWDILPCPSSGGEYSMSGRKPSLLSILSICLHAKPGYEVKFLKLLVRLVLTAFELRRKNLSQMAEAERARRAASFGSANFSDDDIDDDSGSEDENESDDETKGIKKRKKIEKDESILLVIRFFMDKIADTVAFVSEMDRSSSDDQEMKTITFEFVGSPDVLAIVDRAFESSAMHNDNVSCKNLTIPTISKHDETSIKFPPNLALFSTTCAFVTSLLDSVKDDRPGGSSHELESAFFTNMVKLLVRERKTFTALLRSKGDKRQGRSLREKACVAQAEFVAAISARIGSSLSRHLPKKHTEIPGLLENLVPFSPDSEVPGRRCAAPLVQMIESLIWFWKCVCSTMDASNQPGSSLNHSYRGGSSSISAIDRAVTKTLIVPIATALIALTATLGSTSWHNVYDEIDHPETQSLLDFFNSDDSANESPISNEEERNEPDIAAKEDRERRQSLLKKFSQSVHCIFLIFARVEEKTACSLFVCEHGPLLPLVVARVLTHLSDMVLSEFCQNERETTLIQQYLNQKGVWAEAYPYGARKAGGQLDLLLHKGYRCLHGFTLVSSCQSNKDSHTLAAPLSNCDPAIRFFKPESTKAAAQLYRCIRRAYDSNTRKSPPASALEYVASALPHAVESNRSKVIQSFLFENDYQSPLHLYKRNHNDDLPENFPLWVFDCDGDSYQEEINKDNNAVAGTSNLSEKSKVATDTKQTLECNELIDETHLVRKGLCHEMAKGSLPKIGSNSFCSAESRDAPGDSNAANTEAEERSTFFRFDRALYKKFSTVLEDLCFSPCNPEGWYVAAQCATSKADMICDRIITVKETYDNTDFVPPINCPRRAYVTDDESFPLEELIHVQEKEYKKKTSNWIAAIGDDLSIYIRRPWATFSSLRHCSKEIITDFNLADSAGEGKEAELNQKFPRRIRSMDTWREICLLYEQGNRSEWQRSWGGMYVAALKIVAKRCLLVSLYLAKNNPKSSGDPTLLAEIQEALGTFEYLSFSCKNVIYGYPIKKMPNFLKRQLADEAANRFQESIKTVDNCKDPAAGGKEDNSLSLANTYFMIGKCYEKIANTFVSEQYPGETYARDSQEIQPRSYETWMAKALCNYALAHEMVKDVAPAGKTNEGGGSSHGNTEILYRLHASRLKVLIRAVRRARDERENAEQEALRLTTSHWFGDPPPLPSCYVNDKAVTTDNDDFVPKESTRDLVWEVLADVVLAMCQCRLENPYFHRSVYRYAQALLWAPIFYEPDSKETLRLGCLAAVPVTKSYLLRGLDSGACVNSAESIMRCLFDKKRAQLCAVWTTSGLSPFELVNQCVRKYDKLRIKYIGAYVECLRLCRRTEALRSFYGWTKACRRDLPSFYVASGKCGGGQPKIHHAKENLLDGSGLLWFTKRRTNSAIAEIVISELPQVQRNHKNEENYKKKAHNLLQVAFGCFLRLNHPMEDVVRRYFNLGEDIVEVDALMKAFQCYEIKEALVNHESSAWESKIDLLHSSVDRCQELFHSSSFARKKYDRKGSLKYEILKLQGCDKNDSGQEKEEEGKQRKKRKKGENKSPVKTMRESSKKEHHSHDAENKFDKPQKKRLKPKQSKELEMETEA